MKTLTYRTLEGDEQSLPLEAIDRLRAALHGSVITPDDASYDMLRQLWNGMLDRHPALIARCLGANDVAQAINFARDHARMKKAGVMFLEEPRYEPYGTVAVFADLYGNKWDLLELKIQSAEG